MTHISLGDAQGGQGAIKINAQGTQKAEINSQPSRGYPSGTRHGVCDSGKGCVICGTCRHGECSPSREDTEEGQNFSEAFAESWLVP